MKKLFYVLPLAVLLMSCGEGSSDDLDITENSSIDEINEAAASFNDGGATDAETYFQGLVAEVVKIDVHFHEIASLDEIDAEEDDFLKVLDSTVHYIAEGRKGIDMYSSEDWSKRAEFHELTLQWFASIEGLVNDYLYDLAGPMSRADESWTDEENALYEEYANAYSGFSAIDEDWMDFQYEFAAANGFELSVEGYDEGAMIDEELSHMEE
ncbi:MAG: hypothetical protein ACI857_002189 [Arenicella sp.]|jgi:hypothetical protein